MVGSKSSSGPLSVPDLGVSAINRDRQNIPPPLPDRKSRGLLVAIVLGAVVVRVAVMLAGLEKLDDPDHYLTLARTIAEGRGYSFNGRPTAYRPPLYPFLLVPLAGSLKGQPLAWGVGGLHLALGVGTLLLTYLASRRLGLSTGRCLAASAVVAFDPVLVVQSKSVMTETPAAFLVALTLAALGSAGARGALLGGIGFGLGSLCRPSLLSCAILASMAALLVGPGTRKARAIRAALVLAGTFATLAPWAWRNHRIFGELVWTTTHGGYTLALANNPAYYSDVLDGPPGAVWSGPNQAAWFDEAARITAGMPEPEADRRLRSEALRMLGERPGSFARASLARLGRFWGVAPSGAVYPARLRIPSALWTAPLWVALILGLSRRSSREWPGAAAPAIIIALTIVHTFFWADMRMRSPLVPAIAILAASARWPFSHRLRISRRSGAPAGSTFVKSRDPLMLDGRSEIFGKNSHFLTMQNPRIG